MLKLTHIYHIITLFEIINISFQINRENFFIWQRNPQSTCIVDVINYNFSEHLNVIVALLAVVDVIKKCWHWCIYGEDKGTKYPLMSLPHTTLQLLPLVQFWPVVWWGKETQIKDDFLSSHTSTNRILMKDKSTWKEQTSFVPDREKMLCSLYLSLFLFFYFGICTFF